MFTSTRLRFDSNVLSKFRYSINNLQGLSRSGMLGARGISFCLNSNVANRAGCFRFAESQRRSLTNFGSTNASNYIDSSKPHESLPLNNTMSSSDVLSSQETQSSKDVPSSADFSKKNEFSFLRAISSSPNETSIKEGPLQTSGCKIKKTKKLKTKKEKNREVLYESQDNQENSPKIKKAKAKKPKKKIDSNSSEEPTSGAPKVKKPKQKKIKYDEIIPMEERTMKLINSIEHSYLDIPKRLDPQDVETLFRPKDNYWLQKAHHHKLSRTISESFNLSQLKLYLLSYSPQFDVNCTDPTVCAISLEERIQLSKHPLKPMGKQDLADHIIKLWGIGILPDPATASENPDDVAFITEEEFESNKRDLYFLICKGGENLRRLELLGNSTIEINLEDERYTIRGDPTEIDTTRKLIEATLKIQILDLDIEELARNDPNFLRENGDLIAGVAQVAGTYITASPSPSGQKISISGLRQEDIERTQYLLEDAWKLAHPPIPRAVFLHIPEGLPKDGLCAFPSADPAYLPDFYCAHTMFHLRPLAELGPTADKISVESSSLLLPHTIDERLDSFTNHAQGETRIRDIPELLLQRARQPGFETQLEARFGHILNFDRKTFNQPAYYGQVGGNALENLPADSFFLPSFPRHRVWESLVPILEANSIELEYVLWDDMGPTFFSNSPLNPGFTTVSDSYRDPSAYSRAFLTSPVTLCVTLSRTETDIKVSSARFATAPVIADINMLSCHRSLRLMASGYRSLPLTEPLISIFSKLICPGELVLPTPEGSMAVYRLGEIRHQTVAAYSHPCSGGISGRHHFILQSDKNSTGSPPVAKMIASQPSNSNLSIYGLELEQNTDPWANFIRDSIDMCQY